MDSLIISMILGVASILSVLLHGNLHLSILETLVSSRSFGVSEWLRLQSRNLSSSAVSENCKSHKKVTVSACLREGSTKYFDFVVIGSGIAGLRYALEVAKHGSVAVITKAEPHMSATNYAQGGVSAVLCPKDSVESHMQDTIVAGAYLCDEETVRVSFQ